MSAKEIGAGTIFSVVTVVVTMLLAPITQANVVHEKYSGTTLQCIWSNHPVYTFCKSIVPEFEKETGIKVEVDIMDKRRVMDKLQMELGKPEGTYDHIEFSGWTKSQLAARDWLYPLSLFLCNPSLVDPDFDIEDFVPAYLAYVGAVGGPKGYLPGPGASLFALPIQDETSLLAYRKDLFDKYGLAVPDTYDELVDIARFFAENVPGVYGLTMRGQSGHNAGHEWLLFASPFGAKVFDENWEPAFQKAPSLELLRYWKQLVESGPPGVTGFNWGQMAEPFLQGYAAMYLDGYSALFGRVSDPNRSKVVGKVAFALHPKHKFRSLEVGGGAMAIPRNAKNKEAAWLLMQWLLGKKMQKRMAMNEFPVTRTSVITDPEVQAKYPAFKQVAASLDYINPDWRPLIPEWSEVEQEYLGIACNQVITGMKSPEEAMDAIVEPVREIMRKAGYYAWR